MLNLDFVVVPIPPREIDNMPVVALLTLKLVNSAPEPVDVLAVNVADIVVQLKVPLNEQPVNGKNKPSVKDIDVPFIYISLTVRIS
jgi:hypothetical protein